MIRRVMSKRAVGVTYGLRALVIGAVNPLLYVGTAENTHHRTTPYTRLALTGRLFEAVFMGDKDEADRALAYTHKRHVPVEGALPENAGPNHPAGTHYSARDPHLMFMTMAFTMDSAETMYDELVTPLTDTEREDLYQDYVRWGELFGMPREAAPADYPAFRKYFDGYLASDELCLTDEARLVGRYLSGKQVATPFPSIVRYLPVNGALMIQGRLPPRVKRLYGIDWGRSDERVYRGLATTVRAAHRVPPLRAIMTGRSDPLYRVISKREQKVVRGGGESMPGVDPRSIAERQAETARRAG